MRLKPILPSFELGVSTAPQCERLASLSKVLTQPPDWVSRTIRKELEILLVPFLQLFQITVPYVSQLSEGLVSFCFSHFLFSSIISVQLSITCV